MRITKVEMTRLQKILEVKQNELANKLIQQPLSELRASVQGAPPTRGFLKSLSQADKPIALIAEIKKASPSEGILRRELNAAQLALDYEQAGAHALSVLTDQTFFQGSNQALRDVKEVSSLPILRKDFAVHEYDLYEARHIGADAVLLIVACLTQQQLQEYSEIAGFLGLDVLVEVHNVAEADRAIEIGAKLVGINNRDLDTFQTSLSVTQELTPKLASKALVVSESALGSYEDIQYVRQCGARAVLIGTAFCRASDPKAKVKEVMGW